MATSIIRNSKVTLFADDVILFYEIQLHLCCVCLFGKKGLEYVCSSSSYIKLHLHLFAAAFVGLCVCCVYSRYVARSCSHSTLGFVMRDL